MIRSVCLSVILSVSLSICEQDYCKSSQPISLKLGVIIGHTNRKNCLTFSDKPLPDMDSGKLFHSSHRCGIGDFRFRY